MTFKVSDVKKKKKCCIVSFAVSSQVISSQWELLSGEEIWCNLKSLVAKTLGGVGHL